MLCHFSNSPSLWQCLYIFIWSVECTQYSSRESYAFVSLRGKLLPSRMMQIGRSSPQNQSHLLLSACAILFYRSLGTLLMTTKSKPRSYWMSSRKCSRPEAARKFISSIKVWRISVLMRTSLGIHSNSNHMSIITKLLVSDQSVTKEEKWQSWSAFCCCHPNH